jgi:hypothetical protein
MHEDGVGMARTFELEFAGLSAEPVGVQSGFFAWVDGAPASGYRAPRNPAAATGLRAAGGASVAGDAPVAGGMPVAGGAPVALLPSRRAPVGVLTGHYGAEVLRPLLATLDRDDVRVVEVANEFFGGNTGVAGLMVGEDLSRVLAAEPEGHRYLLPDVCLSDGRFLDGMAPGDLPRPVEVIPTDGIALRQALTVGARA